MQNIENINYASDSGAEAIKKLDRNQRKIKEHLDTINVDGMQQQINILNYKEALANPIQPTNIVSYVANKRLSLGFFTGHKGSLTNFTNIPEDIGDDFIITVNGGVAVGNLYYCRIIIRNMTGSAPIYECTVYNSETITEWTKICNTKDVSKVLFIPSSGIVIQTNIDWKNGIVKNSDGSFDLWFAVKKSDGSAFTNSFIQVGSFPQDYNPNHFYIGTGIAYITDLDTESCMCYVDGGRIMFHNTKANAISLMGYVRYRRD